MGSLKERLVSTASSAIFLGIIACNDPKSMEDLTKCNKENQTESYSVFLKDGQKIEVNGWTIQVSNNGSFVMTQKESKDQESIRVDSPNAIVIQPRGIRGIFGKSGKAYTVSGKSALSEDIQGTELTIKVHCNNE